MKHNSHIYRVLVLVRYAFFSLAIPAIYIVKTSTVSNNFIFRKRETKQSKKREREREKNSGHRHADRKCRLFRCWWIASSSAAMDVLWVKRELAIARADRVADGCIIAFGGMSETHWVVAEHRIGCRREPNGNICGIARLRLFESRGPSSVDAFVAFVIDYDSRSSHSCAAQNAERAEFETRHSIITLAVKWNKTKCHSRQE